MSVRWSFHSILDFVLLWKLLRLYLVSEGGTAGRLLIFVGDDDDD